MSVLVIGGDRLGNIYDNLQKKGFTRIQHLCGRKKGHLKSDITGNFDVILVLTDHVNHSLARLVKKRARQTNTTVIYARRSWSDIEARKFRECD
ncbi:MAG: DUF2325 domain-containing protein [Bacillota bacterium]|uniref:DUF2325 domain-containing protein n=1 Tax=Thermanaerosceptrum fracticalcis TaxID=1712410 RepID=A0A7G6E2Y4_THEFR|nr:DUF2325 domain-containing protein [Thermanaerosceptrum fracticalcis]QNB46438.1 DUF2325 domain-containing protein [Thermanaerosceptrum fracticalcis]